MEDFTLKMLDVGLQIHLQLNPVAALLLFFSALRVFCPLYLLSQLLEPVLLYYESDFFKGVLQFQVHLSVLSLTEKVV